MEDIEDKLSHEGKKYYMSHTEYRHRDDFIFNNIGLLKTTQLVCASDKEKAKEAINNLFDTEEYIIFEIRIDNSIIGE